MKKHLLQAQTLYGDYLSAADINGDGGVDAYDAIYLDLYLNGMTELP